MTRIPTLTAEQIDFETLEFQHPQHIGEKRIHDLADGGEQTARGGTKMRYDPPNVKACESTSHG
jgi:hypothetical protein